MKKIIDIFKQYYLSFLIAIFVSVLGLVIVIKLADKTISIKTFTNDYYSFDFDSNWDINIISKKKVELNNTKKGKLIIELSEMEDEYKYSKISEFVDEILYDIHDQNKEYNLISQKEDKITKFGYDGYKLLYESDNTQVMVVVAKSGDKLILFDYEADNKYFDILLDSVQTIINGFELKHNTFDLSYKISVDTKDISYSKNDDLVYKIKSLKNYEIANSNYYVNYSIPDIFKTTSFDSKLGIFNHQDGNGRISLVVNVYNYNIYDYIDASKDYGNVYSEYTYVKQNQDKYQNIIDGISEYNIGDYKGFIYKISYTSTGYITNEIDAYVIIIELNKNHILSIKVEGDNIKIPKELLNSIKINAIKNYSSYIISKKEENTISFELKQFVDYNYNNYETVKFNIPSKYKEIDNKNNIFTERYFGLNYDSNNEVYQYNIHYKLFNLTKEYTINSLNTSLKSYQSYGDVKELSFVEERTINNQVYSVYNASYYKINKVYNGKNESNLCKVNVKILLHELESEGCFAIIIEGNDIGDYNTLFNELSNFEISKHTYD